MYKKLIGYKEHKYKLAYSKSNSSNLENLSSYDTVNNMVINIRQNQRCAEGGNIIESVMNILNKKLCDFFFIDSSLFLFWMEQEVESYVEAMNNNRVNSHTTVVFYDHPNLFVYDPAPVNEVDRKDKLHGG